VNRESPGESPKQRAADDAETTAELRGAVPAHAGNQLVCRHITGAIIGAFYSVHSELGFGFLEAVYGNALALMLERAGLSVERQVAFEIEFQEQNIGLYRADLVVGGRVIVEIKAGRCITPQHIAQLINYLKASRLEVGLLLNFGEKAQFKRVVWTRGSPRNSA
jgi:GxxExxY protein